MNQLELTSTTIIAPKAVVDKLKNISANEIDTLNNGETKRFAYFSVEVISINYLLKKAFKFFRMVEKIGTC